MLELASSIYERCYSGHENLNSTFIEIAKDLGKMPAQAAPDKVSFARRTLERLIANNYGQYDGLITNVAPVLARDGLALLKDQVLKHLQVAPREERSAAYWLQELADQMGDVDSFIGQFSDEQKRIPANAAAISLRLLKQERAQEALDILEGADQSKYPFPIEWDDAKIQSLDDLNRPSDAQTARLDCYRRTLSAIHLKQYLKRLSGNDDFDAEEGALAYALTFPKIELALKFLFEWQALEQASNLIIGRSHDLNGNNYEYLTNWAQTLKGQYPLAATLLLRAMIDYSLEHAKTARYYYAAKHLIECAQISSKVSFPASVEDHERYLKRLQTTHSKKRSFWEL